MKKFLLVLMTLFSTSAFATLNKWVDANGRVHYSDQPPPPNVKAKILPSISEPAPPAKAEGTPAANAPAAPKTQAEREAEMKKEQKAKQEAADKAAKEQAAADAKKANCDAARQNLRTLQSGTRIVEIDASGQRAYLDDAQRQQRITKAQQDIDTFCK